MLSESRKLPVVRLSSQDDTNTLASLFGLGVMTVGALLLISAALPYFQAQWSGERSTQKRSADAENLFAEWERVKSGGEFDLERSINLIQCATVHSDGRRIAVDENWMQWTLGQLYAPALRTQSTPALIEGGVANCSERAQILKSIAESAGVPCRFVGLSGHVVLEIQIDGQWKTADADYGVVYPVTVTELAVSGQSRMKAALSERGYSPAVIERYVSIVSSTDDNHVLPVGEALSPRLDKLEQACRWGIWCLPIGLLSLGGLLFGVKGVRG